MRKLAWYVAAAIVSMVLTGAVWAATFTDVPGDHWSYDAVDYLQDAGLVEGYPDGTFKGDRAFTRYEMAMVIARVFTKIQDWQAMYHDGTLPDGGGNIELSEVYSRLDQLSAEFRDELSDLGARMTAVEDEQSLMRGEVDDLKSLIKDSGLSGVARWRTGSFIATGTDDYTNDVGYEQLITLTYMFQPECDLDFKFSLTSAELEGSVGSGFIPGANNETGYTTPGNPPFGNHPNSSGFVVDEANFKYYFDGPNWLGQCPTITGGKQYFSQGEFGLAGDNSYRSNFGIRYDTSYGRTVDTYLGIYRMSSVNARGVWANPESLSFQSNGYTTEGDDFMLAGLEYHSGEGCIPGHDYKLVGRIDGTVNGYGRESYVSMSGNLETPWLSNTWLTGVRGEWLYMMTNVSNYDPDADLGLTPYSFIIEFDVYNTERTRVSAAVAQMAQIEALPVLANIDNDPFSEWDFTVNNVGDAYNLSREGKNYFPADFFGFGLQAEHTFGNALYTVLTYYSGTRVDASADARPGMARIKMVYPFSNNSTFGLDFVAAGERTGLEDPIALVRGEFKIHF